MSSSRNFLFKFLATLLGCFTSWWLQRQYQFSTPLATALVGLVASFLPNLYKNDRLNLHILIYTGAFIAMSSSAILPDIIHVVLASLLGTVVYILAKPYLNGLGGRLGTIAFIASFIMWMFK